MSVFDRFYFQDRSNIVPGKVSVTLTTFAAAGSGSSTSTVNGRKRPITRGSQFYQNVLVTSDSAEWILDRPATDEVIPKERDTITSGSDVWVIDQVVSGLMESEFHCLCHLQK